MTTLTRPPHYYDAHDAFAALPFVARQWHDGQASALYACSSSGAILPTILHELRTIAGELDYDTDPGEADTVATVVAVLEYVYDRADEWTADTIAGDLAGSYDLSVSVRDGAVFVTV